MSMSTRNMSKFQSGRRQNYRQLPFLADRTIGRAYGTVCRLSVCLSVCRLSSVTFCIVAKRCVLAKKCLKERIGNQGLRVDFLGRRRISTSGFAYMATETAVFAVRSDKPCFSWASC